MKPNSASGVRPGFVAVVAVFMLTAAGVGWYLKSKPAAPVMPEEMPVVADAVEPSPPPPRRALAVRTGPRDFTKRRGAPRRKPEAPPAGPAVIVIPPPPTLEDQWGIQVSGLRLSMANGYIDLRYKVLEPEKAARLADGKTPSYIIDPATGTMLTMPSPPKEGAFPATANKLFAGKTYFTMVANRGGIIRSGSTVTVVVGGVQETNLTVE